MWSISINNHTCESWTVWSRKPRRDNDVLKFVTEP